MLTSTAQDGCRSQQRLSIELVRRKLYGYTKRERGYGDHERRHPSRILRNPSLLRLRQQVHHAQHSQGAEGRYLQRLPSLLHGQIEVRRYGRSYREVQEQVRCGWIRQRQARQEVAAASHSLSGFRAPYARHSRYSNDAVEFTTT